jgi:phospholipid transport system substrate-binding protein
MMPTTLRRLSPGAILLALALAPTLGRAADTASGPAAPIATLDTALAAAEKDAAQPFPQRYAALAPAVDHAFDLPQILHTIIGLRWAQIPSANQAKLLAAFRAFTVASYAANFNTDSGDQFTILPETRTVGADQVVETEIVPKDGDHVRIDYVMRNSSAPAGNIWQAVDVLQQGTISQAAVQRSDFRDLLSGDPTGAALTESLTKRVDKLSGGTVHP